VNLSARRNVSAGVERLSRNERKVPARTVVFVCYH
jgi:hypothetical protein